MDFKEEYSKIKNQIVSIRRKIHQNPELGFQEFETAKLIADILEEYSITYTKGVAKTGVVATIGNSTEKVLLIRADMDALPIQEKTNLPFASKNADKMHACGHDIHIASVLTAAIILKKYEDCLNGTVKIVFQPAEETTGGALPMIEEGVLENPKVTCAIGGHVTSEWPVGTVKTKKGALMASPDDFMIKFIGKSTHGAMPQNGISPILPASEFVLEAKKISTELYEENREVLSVCSIISDGGINTIPEESIILGTFRSFDEVSRRKTDKLLETIATEIAHKHDCRLEYKFNYLYPPLVNNPETADLLFEVLSSMKNINADVIENPLMTGEDFSYFCTAVPSVFFWYGAMNGNTFPLHSAEFSPSEDAIEICANIFCEFALKYFG